MVTGLRALFLLAILALAACSPARHRPAPTVPAPVGGNHQVTYLVLSEAGPAQGQDRAYFTGLGARRISVTFLAQGRGAYSVDAVCDAPARYRFEGVDGAVSGNWIDAGRRVHFRVGPAERGRSWLDLDPATQGCDLTVTPGGRPGWSLHLAREETALPAVARLDAAVPGCTRSLGGDALDRAFMDTGSLSATCPVPVGARRLLPDGLDALNAKIEALTGATVSRAALEAGDPAMALDWTHAPRLDLIYVNYLNLNADFAGYMIARMLAWHAARGTVVRILVSDIMLTDTDRRLFEGLAAQYPTVQLQPYRLPASAAHGLEGQLGRLHRITHVKLFATLAREAGRSRAMIGGRNIHEGYFFQTPRDLSAWPFLHQYDPRHNRLTGGFTAYDDFEVELSRDATVRQIAAHMGALWHRDFDSQAMQDLAPGPGTASVQDGVVRHYISIPFTDGEALAQYYAGLIDAAQQSIHIAIPYLNLPDVIDAALHRAQARGVEVTVVTTVRVREATDFMVSGLNRAFANAFGGWVRFFDYDPFPRLLHAKLITIDGRLAIVASTNLNRRSFAHDFENGLVFMDRDMAQGLNAIIQSYVARGDRVRPGQPVSRLVHWLDGIRLISRAF
ncbi:MAG: phosphatidylserine/phosphatidylglycerophosphate/cardiolipin synthase family protein [Rhodobacter sp.]|nr:phosphatidylserine/phosphatidylglycerophosphate/cardiolipin synthase family protein [Rhodobacter sp.]